VRTYGQFCPIARASELIAERWTPIIIRNLLTGCRTFTEIRQGAPGISPALLAQRLEALVRHGVVESEQSSSGRGRSYRLTERGRDLQGVCDALGQWGARWLEIRPDHLDAAYVLWATTKLVDVSALPERTVVVRVDMRDEPGAGYWLILRQPHPELCTKGLGHTEDIVVRTDSACLVDIHLTRTTYDEALRSSRLLLEGPIPLTRAFATWFRHSPFAAATPGTAAALRRQDRSAARKGAPDR
jgi:DNA-binding HxlR family transcriptional regulator